MNHYLKRILVTFLCVFITAACQHSVTETGGAAIPAQKPKNVILMIGDGMGLAQVSATLQVHSAPLNLEQAPIIGLSRTLNSEQGITDSAAGATAFSIGLKSFNGAIGVDSNGRSHRTILETLSERGYSTGLIATSAITHATPASFYAHVESRDNAYAIAEALAKAPVNLFIGGGKDYFNKRDDEKRGTPDDRDLVSEMTQAGVEFVSDLSELDSSAERVGMFIADGHPKSVQDGRGDILARSILPAASYLKRQSDTGFFLVVEGAQIDWGGHANDFNYVTSELIDFDNALGEALDFMAKQNDTLIVVTADHETGGLTMLVEDYGDKAAKPSPAFSTNGHTAVMVPVFAFGVGSEEFSGVYQNTEIYYKIRNVMGL